MSAVNIKLAADAQGAVKAIDEIRRALERSGQAGKALAAIDLSHPEVKGLAAEIRQLQQNIDDLVRSSTRGGTAAAGRQLHTESGGVPFGSGSRIGWLDRDAWLRMHPGGEGDRRFTSATSYITQGTRWQPRPAPPPAPTSSASNDDGDRKSVV
jgi:hypothetical protein